MCLSLRSKSSLRQAARQRHLAKVKALYEDDLTEGYGAVYLPYAFERKDAGAYYLLGVAVCLPRFAALH